MKISYQDYLAEIWEAQDRFHFLRLGQICFIVLYLREPELANEIRGTELDPFFKDDEDMDNFWYWIARKFDSPYRRG